MSLSACPHRAQCCLLSQPLEMGRRAGNGRPFGLIIVEVSDINTTGGPGGIREAIMQLYLFVYVCASAYRASVFDIPDVEIEFVGFRQCGCASSSFSHLGLPYTIVTNKRNAILKVS